VQTTRHLRRTYTKTRSQQAWHQFCQQRNLKGRILQKAKEQHYREKMSSLTTDIAWNTFRWAKAFYKGPQLNTLPTLKKGQITAISLAEKTRLLQEEAF
jgi:hypothetical protein